MLPKTIVRIEHSNGNGIWRACDGGGNYYINNKLSNYNEFSRRHEDFPNPTWQHDVYGFVEGKHYCAFKSIEQLQKWVYTSEIKELLEMGFKVWMLDVTEYIEGNYQIVYTKESIVSSKDISSLFV